MNSSIKETKGKWYFYNEDGICECEGTLYDNLKHGKWKYYNEEGDLIEKIRYRHYSANYNYSFLELCKWR